ncbi:hypothetical protein VNO77_37339 [Canavalia gladiata]|uniref:Zinc knuckle CX2CX4HX4C domain-containing protein n=1 Tax=Canavalia gladiata TaxID=3824 RepID=A0AAN9KC03_CANGL
MGTILCYKVKINLHRPLKKGMWFKRHDGHKIQFTFQYEILSNFCYIYGYLGHIMKNFPNIENDIVKDDGESLYYRLWLCATSHENNKISKDVLVGTPYKIQDICAKVTSNIVMEDEDTPQYPSFCLDNVDLEKGKDPLMLPYKEGFVDEMVNTIGRFGISSTEDKVIKLEIQDNQCEQPHEKWYLDSFGQEDIVGKETRR